MKSIHNYVCFSLGDRKDEDEFGLRKERTWWWTVRERDFKFVHPRTVIVELRIHIWMIF